MNESVTFNQRCKRVVESIGDGKLSNEEKDALIEKLDIEFGVIKEMGRAIEDASSYLLRISGSSSLIRYGSVREDMHEMSASIGNVADKYKKGK